MDIPVVTPDFKVIRKNITDLTDEELLWKYTNSRDDGFWDKAVKDALWLEMERRKLV